MKYRNATKQSSSIIPVLAIVIGTVLMILGLAYSAITTGSASASSSRMSDLDQRTIAEVAR